MRREVNRQEFIEEHLELLKQEGLGNLLLAADCFEEVRDCSEILVQISQRLLQQLQHETETESSPRFNGEAAQASRKNCNPLGRCPTIKHGWKIV